MKTIRLTLSVLLATGALVLLSSTASSQQKSDKIEAGVTAQGLALGQIRPMTVAIAKQLAAAGIKASCSPPMGSCSGAFCVADDAGVKSLVEMKGARLLPG